MDKQQYLELCGEVWEFNQAHKQKTKKISGFIDIELPTGDYATISLEFTASGKIEAVFYVSKGGETNLESFELPEEINRLKGFIKDYKELKQ